MNRTTNRNINRSIPGLLAATGFSFLGLFGGQTQEYGDLTDALKRTIAQSAPPYHETADTGQRRTDSGASPVATAPASPNPPAATEQTPRAQ
jgi:hypothetical protein